MVSQASRLRDVRYDIRGPVLRRARQLEAEGHQILKLNLGNPAPFGLLAPGAVVDDVVRSIDEAQGYSDARGIYPARLAVAESVERKGVAGGGPDDGYLGSGVSGPMGMAPQGVVATGDDGLRPTPDGPLGSGARGLGCGRAGRAR